MARIQYVLWLLVTPGRLAALRRLLLLLVAPLLANNVMAGPYPERPITIVVPFTAGGIVDIVARKLAAPMSAALGQPVLVENKTGAAGLIGYTAAARAKPDGYSLVLASGSLTLGLAYQPSVEIHPVRSYSAVGMIGHIPQAIVVNPEVPAQNVADFVRIAKEKPGIFNFGSVGPGTTPFFTIELLRQIHGLDLVHIPYRGQPEMISDLLRGSLSISSITAPLVTQHVNSSKMKAIAVTGRERLPYMPQVPTVYEQGLPRLDITNWFALLGPASLPEPIVEKLAQALNGALRNPEVAASFEKMGLQPATATPAETMAFVEKDYTLWTEISKGVKKEAAATK
jgi:tripartite-type tricarboxylate transporter receptor subunit TctC